MINDVRNTVLSILNKDNHGYLTPEQFNLYSDMAQKELFEQLFHDYSRSVYKRNNRVHNSEHGDIPKRIEEVIGRFETESPLTYDGTTLRFELPSDYYSIGTVVYNNTTEVYQVSKRKYRQLNGLLDGAPTTSYPIYTIFNESSATVPNQIAVLPSSINTTGDIVAEYVRYPQTPKWTYSSFSAGEPLFDQSANDYQDFELPDDYFGNLVSKICEYAGVQIRAAEVVQTAAANEAIEKQQEQ